MKQQLIYCLLLILISFSNSKKSLPHFIFDGIESYHECGEKDKISFTIYGRMTEKLNLRKVKIEDYLIDDIGLFKCSLSEIEKPLNSQRKHKIVCTMVGSFIEKGYILEEPKVHGFDFLTEEGESTWPEMPEKRTFLIGECGAKIELDNEPLLLASSSNYTSPLKKVDKAKVNKSLSYLPKRESTSETDMCTAMKKAQTKYSLNQAESAYFVFRWISENIAYDCYSYVHGGIDYKEESSYTKGKAVCEAYSLIFKRMCEALGLETIKISGYSKGTSFVPGNLPTRTNHAWNAVKIDSVYYLVDSTWGSGSCDKDKFTKKLKEFYFCTKPEAFVNSHLPADNKWQLTSKIITLKEFVETVKLNIGFYENGFETISPSLPILNVEEKSKVTLTYDKSISNLTITNHIYYLQGNNYVEMPNTIINTKKSGKFEVSFITNKIGNYKLNIYGGLIGAKSYEQLVEIKINCTKAPKTALFYPKIYSLYTTSETEIIDPLYMPLKKGNSYTFKVRSTYSNMYVWDGAYKEMKKGTNGLFTSDKIKISGDKIKIYGKDSSYRTLAEYNTTSI